VSEGADAAREEDGEEDERGDVGELTDCGGQEVEHLQAMCVLG